MPANSKLADVELAFVDSRAALAAAVREGLSDLAVVRSTAPALVLGSESRVEAADGKFASTDVTKLNRISLVLNFLI